MVFCFVIVRPDASDKNVVNTSNVRMVTNLCANNNDSVSTPDRIVSARETKEEQHHQLCRVEKTNGWKRILGR